MGWRDWTSSFQPVRRHCGFAVSLASTVLLSLSGTTLAAAAAPSSQLLQSPSSPAGPGANSAVTVSLNLGDLFQNVFRYIQVSNISDQEEVNLGQQINQIVLSQEYSLYDSSQVQAYVNQVGQRLVAANDGRDIPYRFQVVVDDAINAFAVPGGYVYVTTGLLRSAENEAQLASVLAHEISHIDQRHGIDALKRATLAQGVAGAVGLDMNTLAQLGYQLAINLPRTRDLEYAADADGLDILQAAGYPPEAFVNFLEQLMNNAGTPEFLRTHPTSLNRIRQIRAQIAENAPSTPAQRGRSTAAYQDEIAPLM